VEHVSAFRKESNLSSKQTDLTSVFIAPSLFPKPSSQIILKCPAVGPREFLKSEVLALGRLRFRQGQT